jgi:hypothetical protein
VISKELTTAEFDAIEKLNEMTGQDPERDHSRADDLLLELVHPDVKAAFLRARDRCEFWYA